MAAPERPPGPRPGLSPERWATVRSVAEAALDRAPDARDAFLSEACGADVELRALVDRLVISCERSGQSSSFLAGSPAADIPALVDATGEALSSALADRYEIEREIGRGGMATVYLARDVRHGRHVAVKVLEPGLRASLSAERFLREVRITARLTHPHILPLHDSGESNDILYYVMPFVDGESLRQRLRREPRPSVDAVVRIVREVASALDYAHRSGIIHRDIKPENILLQDGHAVVADFGIARAVSRARDPEGDPSTASTLTQAGMSLGTPAYMAPEQALGDAATDHRADLYALGVIAYEALAGRHPFGARSAQAMVAAHLAEEPPPIVGSANATPQPLAALVMRLLAKDPAARPQSAEEVLHALEVAGSVSAERASSADAHAGPRRVSTRRRALPLVAAGLLLIAAIGAYAASRGRTVSSAIGADTGRAATAAAARPSVAVMPFANTGGAEADAHFSAGLTDELIGTLGKMRGLRVAGRTSSYALGGRGLGTRAIADTLGVGSVLEGSVRRAGDRLKIIAQLVDASDDAILWTESYDREVVDVFAVQEEIARAIASALRVTLGADAPGAGRTRRPTESAEANELYLRGRFLMNSSSSRAAIDGAAALFEQAVALDPDFARAHAGLSDAHARLAIFGYGHPHEEFAKAKAAARRALALDSTLADAHVALGHAFFVYDFDRVAGERELRRALELDPGLVYGRIALAILLQDQERFDEAIEQLELARTSDPLAPFVDNVLGRVYVSAGKPDLAIRHLRLALQLNPQLDLAYQQLGHAHLAKRMYPEAIAALRRAAELSGIRDSAHLAYAYAVSGNRGEAERVVRLLTSTSGSRYLPPYHIALAYAGLGDVDQAFRWLERGYEDRASFMDGVKIERGFAPLHGDPRWSRLMQRMGYAP